MQDIPQETLSETTKAEQSAKGHTPREAKDDLKSTQQLSVIDALSEGPIVGPVNGLQSVLINNTPVVDADGNSNIHGVTVVYQVGETPQAPLEGFEASGAETVLGVEVKHDNPVTRTVVSENVDRLPAHHWRRKAVLLPEQQPPEQKMPQNGQKISRT